VRDTPELDERLSLALKTAANSGLELLGESAAFAVARELGLQIPHRVELTRACDAASLDLEKFSGDRLVVKALSSEIAHKADVGAVAFCAKNHSALERALGDLAERIPDTIAAAGYAVHEYFEHDRSLGDELLLGVHWTDDFGPVGVLGLGGVEVERLTAEDAFAPVLLSAAVRNQHGELLPRTHPLVRFLTEPYRGQPPRFEIAALEEILERLLMFADGWMAVSTSSGASDASGPKNRRRIAEFEINPLVMTARGPTALDALLRRATSTPDVAPPRPIEKLGRLLAPSSIAIAGVSQRQNIGRIILQNILGQGFAPERVWIVKPDVEEIEGCRCFPDFGSLPEPADLAVLSVGAAQLPDLVEEIIQKRLAESLILIPGGLGEREGSEKRAAQLKKAIRGSRTTAGGGPIVNGGNCLGVRSLPGGYDTLFIPGHKLAFAPGGATGLALLSQSGAFAVARASKLDSLNPAYVVTFGNQVDLTLGDYLTYLEPDPTLSVFACYVEGFQPLDGLRFLEAVRRLRASGRTVILYSAGRTRAGARAAASHTASVAGRYRVTCELAQQAGALVAESIEEFEDLVRTFTLLGDRRPKGRRLGALTNAGFESVAIGDNLTGLELAVFGPATHSRLADLFRRNHIDTLVTPGNPLDVTPVLDDEAFAAAARMVLRDADVDLGILGCVPLTGALQTLPAGEQHNENLAASDSVAQRLIEIWRDEIKPWVAVIDAGRLYDPLANTLDKAGVPIFRSADRALGALGRWASFHLTSGRIQSGNESGSTSLRRRY